MTTTALLRRTVLHGAGGEPVLAFRAAVDSNGAALGIDARMAATADAR